MRHWLVIGLIVALALFFVVGCGEEKKPPIKKIIKKVKPITKKIAKPVITKKAIKSPEKNLVKFEAKLGGKALDTKLAKEYEGILDKKVSSLKKVFDDQAKKNKKLQAGKLGFTIEVDKAGKVKIKKQDAKDKALVAEFKKVIEGWKDIKAKDKPVELTFEIIFGKKEVKKPEPKKAPEPKKKVAPKGKK